MEREEMLISKEIEELNLVYSQSKCTPWDLERIGQKIENFEKAEIQINELGEGIKQLHFKIKEGKIKISFETEWKFVSTSGPPQPINCVEVSVIGKADPTETKRILKKLREALVN